MSVALGKNASTSSIMLGKALQDPIKGITSLGRAGVIFTQGQKDQIKTLVESGHKMGAQKVILKELGQGVWRGRGRGGDADGQAEGDPANPQRDDREEGNPVHRPCRDCYRRLR